MKIIAVNGSPRKNWNTAALLKSAMEGAQVCGAQTELFHLYDYAYQGCRSCFACKRKNTATNGLCAMRDELAPLYRKIAEADALLIGAPIYIAALNGMTHSFLERLVFPYLSYGAPVAEKKVMKSAFLYTLGATRERAETMGYDRAAVTNKMLLERVYGPSEYLLATDTYQFDNYANYETSGIDVAAKTRGREEVFPEDCKKACELGAWLTRA